MCPESQSSGPSAEKLSATKPPAIAVIDTGVDATRADFAGRVVSQVTLTTLPGNSVGDGSGHGTFVAALAAGSAAGYAGAAPTAQILSIDVADDKGMSMTSDVIAAVDWILANKDAKKIGVANFSLHSSVPGSFVYDPLAKAVERLWLSGVVVVAAAGNYATNGAASGVPFAPANSPFVITVGAADIGSTTTTSDDVAAPWSAHGYTLDGFAKPELGAPGRYLVGTGLGRSEARSRAAGKHRQPGYMRLSGTSFAAPLVAGAAAQLLALHPGWTPDQVKGALMVSAAQTNAGRGLGVGELDAFKAASVQTPPNPNVSLLRFVANGSFDSAGWTAAVRNAPAWNAASWSSASWSSASWSSRLVVERILVVGLMVVGIMVIGLLVVGLVVERLLELRLLDELALRARPVPRPLERGGALEHGAQLVLQEDEPDRVEALVSNGRTASIATGAARSGG